MHVSSPAGVRAGWRWAVVALVALLAVSVTVGTASPARVAKAAIVGEDRTPGADWGTLDASYAQQVLTLVNQHRAAMGLSALLSRRRSRSRPAGSRCTWRTTAT